MAHLFRIDRVNNKIGFPFHTASKILALDGSKNLEVVTIGSSLDYTRPTLNTIQDIRTTANVAFGSLSTATNVTVGNILSVGSSPIGSGSSIQMGDYGETLRGIIRYGADINNDLIIQTGTTLGQRAIILRTEGVQRLRVHYDGKVNIGAGTPVTLLTVEGIITLPKTSGSGIKVDTATPTFGFADLLGDQFSKNTGGTKPTLTTYNGAIDAWQFSDGDEAFLSYHIPHDYVPGTDIHLHIHWSQNNAGATGGTIDFKYFAIYAKGHNQVSGSTFTSTPITDTFSSIDINDGDSGLNQYQQHITEVTISAATATAALFDRDDLEPDGAIELTFEMDANNLTGTPSDPFIHFVDIHYQTTGLIGTKSRTPDFYT